MYVNFQIIQLVTKATYIMTLGSEMVPFKVKTSSWHPQQMFTSELLFHSIDLMSTFSEALSPSLLWIVHNLLFKEMNQLNKCCG